MEDEVCSDPLSTLLRFRFQYLSICCPSISLPLYISNIIGTSLVPSNMSSQRTTVPNISLGNGTDARGLPLPGWRKDPNSISMTRKHKPSWYFSLPNRGAQSRGMREIKTLYEGPAELSWEEKWEQVEATIRLNRPDVFAETKCNNSRIERLTNPNIFAGCNTAEERKAALVGGGLSKEVSSIRRSISAEKANRSGRYREGTIYDQAGIWQMLVDACEKASREPARRARRCASA